MCCVFGVQGIGEAGGAGEQAQRLQLGTPLQGLLPRPLPPVYCLNTIDNFTIEELAPNPSAADSQAPVPRAFQSEWTSASLNTFHRVPDSRHD